MGVKFKKEGDWADGQQFDLDAVQPALGNSVGNFLPSTGGNATDYGGGGFNPYFANIPQGMDSGAAWASTDRYIYEHETGFGYDSATPFAESGAIEIGSGERLTDVTELIPDESNLGDTSVIFKTRNFPTATETTSSSISMANPTSVRLTARQVRIRVSGNTASDWRYGDMRLNVQAGSRR